MVDREDILNKLNIKNIILLIREESLLVKENLCLQISKLASSSPRWYKKQLRMPSYAQLAMNHFQG